MRYFAILMAALFISGAAVAAQDAMAGAAESDAAWVYGEWDANDDGWIDEDEFKTGYQATGLFDEWDANNDGVLDEDELGDGLYNYYETSGDSMISEEEVEGEGYWDM